MRRDTEDASVAGRVALRKAAAISAAPDGPAMAVLERSGEAAVLERSRDWVKVRVEGWVRSADVAAEIDDGPRITGSMIRQSPDRYVGQAVTWRLQFLAIQRADELRPEMPRGQAYLLARGPLPESGFTYVMVDANELEQFKSMAPLDEIRIEGIIRAGRTRYLPTPVVELVKAHQR